MKLRRQQQIVVKADEEMRKDLVFPVLCMSGLHDVGSDRLLDLIVEAFPSPLDRPAPTVTVRLSAM